MSGGEGDHRRRHQFTTRNRESSILNCDYEILRSWRSPKGENNRRGIAGRDVGHYHIELIETDDSRHQTLVGDLGRNTRKGYAERRLKLIEPRDKLTRGDVGRYRPEPDTVHREVVSRLCPSCGNARNAAGKKVSVCVRKLCDDILMAVGQERKRREHTRLHRIHGDHVRKALSAGGGDNNRLRSGGNAGGYLD